MRPIVILVAVVSLVAGPALAQGLIAPSRQYNTPKREKLDKTYGLPTFGTPGESMPKQQTMAPIPKQEARPDPFRPMQSLANPDAPASDSTPDFFQRPSGLATSETGVPNFFQDTQERVRPRAKAAAGGETSMFTTDQGTTTGDTSSSRTRPIDGSDD